MNKFSLLELYLKTVLFKSLDDSFESSFVFFEVFGENNNIVEIDETGLADQSFQDLIHHALEGGPCVRKADCLFMFPEFANEGCVFY